MPPGPKRPVTTASFVGKSHSYPGKPDHLQTHLGPLADFYLRLRAQRHVSIAAVAAARKMAEAAFHITNDEPYRYAQPERTQAKLDELYRRATGASRPRSRPEVKPENEAEKPTEPGFRREVKLSLNDVYETVGLPTIQWDSLSPGERRPTTNTATYVAPLQETYATYRRTRKKLPETP